MSRASDTGNFLIFILFAGFVGVMIGEWAGRAVLYIGMVVMIVGAVLYVLNWLGIDWSSIFRGGDPAESSRSDRRGSDSVHDLLRAVEARDDARVEKLVLNSNVSPFEAVDWSGSLLSANGLATRMEYGQAMHFFKDWSSRGALARIGGQSND